MKFTSKLESYTHAIFLLLEIYEVMPGNSLVAELINNSIEAIRIAFENHQQDPAVVIDLLQYLIESKDLSYTYKLGLRQLKTSMETSQYLQTVGEKFENPFARRFESEMAIALLLDPTTAIMRAVGEVSHQIINYLEAIPEEYSNQISCTIFQENTHIIKFGSFPSSQSTFLSIEQIKDILRANEPNFLIEIIHIHYKIGQFFVRDFPICHHKASHFVPVGKFSDYIQDYYQEFHCANTQLTPIQFFLQALRSADNKKARMYISNTKMYETPLYTAGLNRGRLPSPDTYFWATNRMGLMLHHQDAGELPVYGSPWIPDCRNQLPDFGSQHVLDLIDNDCVYVAGASGMMSVLLNLMEIIANLKHEYLKQHYLAAIASYIVGGGFHSWHEALGPAQYALNLIPGYAIQVIKPGTTAPPPNYHLFFMQQAAIDLEFRGRRERAWQNYMSYYRRIYHLTYAFPPAISSTSSGQLTPAPYIPPPKDPSSSQPYRLPSIHTYSELPPPQQHYIQSSASSSSATSAASARIEPELQQQLLEVLDFYILKWTVKDKNSLYSFFEKIRPEHKEQRRKQLRSAEALKRHVLAGDLDAIKTYAIMMRLEPQKSKSYEALLSTIGELLESTIHPSPQSKVFLNS